MRDQLVRDTEKLAVLFSELVHRVLVTQVLEPEAELTCAQLEALQFLARHDPNHVGDLAAGLDISYPAATKAVDRLVAKALVTRRESTSDRRQSELSVTEHGRELLETVLAARRTRMEALLLRMPAEEQRALLKGLKGFITAGCMLDKDLIEATCLRCGTDCYPECVLNQAHVALLGSAIPRV